MNNAVALAIKVTSDARGAAAGIDAATGKVSKLGRAGQVAGRLLAAGLLVAAGAAIKFTQAAAEDQQAQAQLAQTAQQAAGATAKQTSAMEDWITAQGKAKGVADDELRPALSKLITATHDVGKAQQLASLAMDISARSGKSLDSVSQALAKAQNGSVAGLGKYGVATKDAAGKTLSLAQVQKNLADTYKGASAAAADTAAGKAKIMSVQMGELQEQIGTALIPVMSKLVDIGLKVVDWISKNITVVGAIVGAIGTFLVILKAISLAQAAYNAILAANPIVLVVAAVIALAVALVIAYKKSETFRNIVNAAFSGITKVVSAVVDFIRDHWRAMLVILGGPIGLAVVLIHDHFDKIKAAALIVVGWVRDHWPLIKALIVTPFQDAKTVIGTVWDKISTAISTAKSTISTTLDGIRAAVQAIVDAFQAVIDKVQAVIDKIKSIPHPDIPGFGRSSTGGGGLPPGFPFPPKGPPPATGGAGARETHIHVHLDGYTFVGDELQLARKLEQVLSDNQLRLNLVPA